MIAQTPRQKFFVLWRIFALLLGSLLWYSNNANAAEAQPQRTFRVMTYNIHHGEGLDQKVDLQRIARLIKQERADIVCLQEVDQETERTARRDFPAEFATLTGMSCVFSNNYSFQGGRYGNAVLTPYPIKSVTNTLYKMLAPGEQRGLLQLVLDVEGHKLVLMNTHLDYRPNDRERLSNAGEIREIVKSYGEAPIILCGDFNDVPGSSTWQAFSELFIDTWKVAGAGDGNTIPAAKPNKRIDFIWLSKEAAFAPVKVWVPKSNASDHLPVVAEFSVL